MERVIKFFIVYKTIFALLFCIVLSTFLIFSNQTEQVSILRGKFTDFSSSITQKLNWFSLVFSALEVNDSLRVVNERLSSENWQFRELREENDRLRDLLEFKKNAPFDFQTGQIVHWYPPFLSTVTINLGQNDRIKKNDPVITNDGLVGKIITSGKNSAICQLLTDGSFKVSAQIKNSDIIGFLRYKEDNYAVIDIRGSATVDIGDTVVTSSHGNIYPIGIQIGTIIDFTREPGLFKTATVKLFVNYARLRDVSVITNVNSYENK